MAILTVDLSGRLGLAERFFGETASSTPAPQARYLAKDGQLVGGTYNPFRKYGFLSPVSNTYTNVSGALANRIRCTQYESGSQNIYLGESGSQIWKISDSGTLTATSATTIGGSSVAVTDLEIYQVNGVKKLFAAYQKTGGGGGDVLIASVPYAAENQTWLSGTVSGAFNTGATNDCFFISSDNGFLYLADGAALHKIDGTSATGGANGTAYPNVLQFPVYFTLVDGVDYRGKSWICAQSGAPYGAAQTAAFSERIVGVYVWDRQTTQVNMNDFIILPGVREIRKIWVGQDGELLIFCISSSRLAQIRKFKGSYWGSTFDVIDEFALNAYPQYRDSVAVIGQTSLWLGTDGKFYAQGRITPVDVDGLYRIGDASSLATGGSMVTGAICAADGNSDLTVQRQGVYFSMSDGTPAVYLKKWYLNGIGTIDSNAQNPLGTEIFAPQKYIPRNSILNNIMIMCDSTTGSGATTQATVKIYINNQTTATYSITVTIDDIAKGYIFSELGIGYVNAVQVSVTYPTGITMGANDFTPSIAMIDYTPTNGHK